MKVYKEMGDKELREYGVLPWGENSPGTYDIDGTKRQYAGVILQGGDPLGQLGECLFDVTEDFKKLTSDMTADELDAFESDCYAKDNLWHSFHANFMESTGMEIHDGPFEVYVSDLIGELKDKIEEAMETQIDKLKFVNEEIKLDFMSNFEWAKGCGMEETFLGCVNRLCEWADGEDGEVWIGHDFSSRSFSFSYARNGKQMLNGGMIFHGSHDNGGDGSAPTFSVNLNPHDGWRLHT